MKNVFIVGSKSLGMYGGYETFVYKLIENNTDKNLRYHVACKQNGQGASSLEQMSFAENVKKKDGKLVECTWKNSRCFFIKVPELGALQAIIYDVKALSNICKYIKKNKIEKPVVYILACRIGLFSKYFKKKINKMGGKLYLNPDGHEWKRSKWNRIVRKYWKVSEQLMVKYSDLVICDSVNIEKYINENYGKYNIKTTYISYGADLLEKQPKTAKLDEWYRKFNLSEKDYYLMVGRFVPENNYEAVLREFLKTDTKKKLVVITTENQKFTEELEEKLHFKKDERIVFPGAVYDGELLRQIRENAFAYIHGHEVGGTNPSLLESLATTDVNLLLNVVFNKEVGKEACLYWSKKDNSLCKLINKVDKLSDDEIEKLGIAAKDRIEKDYKWSFISEEYNKVFSK